MEEDDEIQTDAAIAEAMGFSNFGMQPGKKRKRSTNTSFGNVKTKDSASQVADKASSDMISGVLIARGSDGLGAMPEGTAHTASSAGEATESSQQEAALRTISPDKSTATASTIHGNDANSLRALQHGVRNENGDMVYFLPSFLEDPWRNLKPQ